MIVVLIACEAELPPIFKKNNPNYWTRIQELESGGLHKYIHLPILIIITGIGQQTKNTTNWIIEHIKPTEIINIGTAGATNIAQNTWVSVFSVIQKNKTTTMNQHQSLPIPTYTFPSVTCETISNNKTESNEDIVDMESAYIAAECKKNNIPCNIIKYITDSNNQNTDTDFNTNLPNFHTALNTYLSTIFNPKPHTVSVIIPTHNRHTQVNTALQSVLKQTHRAHQIICIDDASLPPIPPTYKQIQYTHLHKQSGVSAARNSGIQQATGEWIAFLDSDDTWEPTHLQTLMEYLNKHPYLRWAQTEEKWIRNAKHLNKKNYHAKPVHWGWEPSLERCLVTPSAVMIHKSMFKEFGTFNESLNACEDYDLWLRFLRHTPIGYIKKETVTKYGGHTDQLSTKYTAMDHFRVFSLIEQYNKETNTTFKQKLTIIINKKTGILKQGAEKRHNTNAIGLYNQILDHLNSHTLIPKHIYETLLEHVQHSKN
jgi:glycosyltransferase involved in cell wall biosynthesis/nucleoside phosphorylase